MEVYAILRGFTSDFWKIIIVDYLTIKQINNMRVVNKFFKNLINQEFPFWINELRTLKKFIHIHKLEDDTHKPIMSKRCNYKYIW